MSFLSNLLDAIPVVGHVKGVVHYAVGDTEGGHKAMYQSTRTSAVIAGGVVGGILGGPAGAAVGAIHGGATTDTLASVAMGNAQGILRDCGNIGMDIVEGRNPTVSVLVTGAHLAVDAFGGMGLDGLFTATANSVGKKIASNVGEEIIEKSVIITAEEMASFTAKKATETVLKKTVEKSTEQCLSLTANLSVHIAERAMLETVQEEIQAKKKGVGKSGTAAKTKENNEEKADKKEESKRETGQSKPKTGTESGSQPSKQKATAKDKSGGKSNKGEKETDQKPPQSTPNMGSGSGSQPPKENKDNEKIDDCSNKDIFSEFLKLLKRSLENICRNVDQEMIYNIFENLSPGQIWALVKLIKKLKNYRTLEAVLNLVIEIFDQYFFSDFTFPKFLCMMEFVKTYINDEIEKHIISENSATLSADNFQQLQTYLITVVTSDFNIEGNILDAFYDIRAEIEAELKKGPPNSNFRDIFAAVYHYFKHKNVPDDGKLSVSQYYYYIRTFLSKITLLPAFIRLMIGQNPSNQITTEWYVAEVGRRVRIVVKFEDGKTVLASCYFVDTTFIGDEDGDKFINIKNKNKYRIYPWPGSDDPPSSDSEMTEEDE